ncbi:hypothetical protein L6164_020820 [Bauhinia variegata]|uniref:Uncharacterized protein n=1 Tax=Bauhinia variegata TaxID=167791 RepID=A0ACB9MW80_BAUVA|nr:hypothetical protein L6164_020820 [Bauhinia variegata]
MKVGAVENVEVAKDTVAPRKGFKRGLSILDFIFRIIAAIATAGSALAMGTAKQTLPFATQFVRFRARFSDLPTFVFFVITNSIICAYLVLSLILSFYNIIRSVAVKSRILLAFLDTVMLGLLTSAASAAAAIVYLAHYGNPNANWFAICRQYGYFCSRISGSVVGSFLAVVLFMLLILMSAVAVSWH